MRSQPITVTERPRQVRVENLASSVTASYLARILAQYGSVVWCNVVLPFGTACFDDPSEATIAAQQLDGRNCEGQRLRVRLIRGSMNSN